MPHIIILKMKAAHEAQANFLDKLAAGLEELENNGPNQTLESAIESSAGAYLDTAAAAFGSAGEEIQNAM